MPWQQYVADVILEIDPLTGGLAYGEFGLTVPRQSGKSTLLLAKAVHRASATRFFGPRQRVVYTAQTRQKAREKWEEDFVEDLLGSQAFKAKVVVHKGNGNEHVRFPNKSRFGIEANTEKAGHGGTLDEAYIDEAFAHVDNRMEQAFRPAMITRRNKQLGWVSTAGWLDASPYLKAKVAKGQEQVELGIREGMAYFEWSAPEGADPGDPDVWRGCMPALGHTITEQAIAAEYHAMGEADFKRAYLNLWVPKAASDGWIVISEDRWAAVLDPSSRVADQPVFAVDVAVDGASAAIAVTGSRADGLDHGEVVEYRPGEGTGWVAGRLVDIGSRWSKALEPVVNHAGPAGALIADLEAAGLRPYRVGPQEMAQACGSMVAAVKDRTFRHIGQEPLDEAVKGAEKRLLADAWALTRRGASVDISPLVAVVLARHRHAATARQVVDLMSTFA